MYICCMCICTSILLLLSLYILLLLLLLLLLLSICYGCITILSQAPEPLRGIHEALQPEQHLGHDIHTHRPCQKGSTYSTNFILFPFALRRCSTKPSTILYYTIPYYTIPYYTILYYTILYYTYTTWAWV